MPMRRMRLRRKVRMLSRTWAGISPCLTDFVTAVVFLYVFKKLTQSGQMVRWCSNSRQTLALRLSVKYPSTKAVTWSQVLSVVRVEERLGFAIGIDPYAAE